MFATFTYIQNYKNLTIYFQTAYKQYFEWKPQYKFYKSDPFCDLCSKLHDSSLPAKTYPDVSKWFHEDSLMAGVPYCKNGSERAYYKSMFQEK